MNRNSIAVGHDELGRYIREVLIANGARAKDAAVVAEGLVWANLRGGDGHGVSRLPRYLDIIAHGEIDTKAEPKLSHDRSATFVLDCQHGFGPVAVMQAAALAVERAKQAGVCFGLVRETTHTGAIGRYAQWIAEQGCAAVLVGAGPTLMAYHGTRVASLSTSPIAIAVPSGAGPILLDMASSAIANGKILQARNTGCSKCWRACSRLRRSRSARLGRKSAPVTPAIPRCSPSTSKPSARSPALPTTPTR